MCIFFSLVQLNALISTNDLLANHNGIVHRTKYQESGNLNIAETRGTVAETQRLTRVSVSGYVAVSHVSVAAFSTEPEHFFSRFRQISVARFPTDFPASRVTFCDGRVTLLAGPTFLHINTLARLAGSTRLRRDDQSMRELCCYWKVSSWLGQRGQHFSHINAR